MQFHLIHADIEASAHRARITVDVNVYARIDTMIHGRGGGRQMKIAGRRMQNGRAAVSAGQGQVLLLMVRLSWQV